jgi:hypothetical protein
MTEDALLNTPMTALVILGAAIAMAMAINANMIAYSTIVTPWVFFFCMTSPYFVKSKFFSNGTINGQNSFQEQPATIRG